MTSRRFIPQRELGLRTWATGPVQNGRLTGPAHIVIADLDVTTNTVSGTKPPEFALMTAGDVTGLAPGAITRRFPAPGSSDAETTKAALIEFAPADLPWRYTPARPGAQTNATGGAGQGLAPWLVLVVGEPTELSLAPDGTVGIAVSAQTNHPLVQSWTWAHIQQVDGHEDIGRIVSPFQLEAHRLYLACLVPGFVVTADGAMAPAWDGSRDVRLPCYDHWTFTTGDEGDFGDLAQKITERTYAELGDAFGIGAVRYNRRGLGSPDHMGLGMEGALTRVSPAAGVDPVLQSAHEPLPSWVVTEVRALSAEIPLPPGRWILTAPDYGEPYVGRDPVAKPAWAEELVEDPRRRAAAGLGVWNAIEWQERIAVAAMLRAGDLLTAQDRIRHLALGLEAARSLWTRHVPDDPVGRLAVLSPVLARLPEQSGDTALGAVAGRARLTRALFSSAARRALRPGSARTLRAAPGAADPRAVLIAACRCPKPPPTAPAGDIAASVQDAVRAAARDDALTKRVLGELGASPPPDLLAAVLSALDPGGGRPPDLKTLDPLLQRVTKPPTLSGGPGEREQSSCRDIDPAALGRIVAAAVDPTVERPLVVDRVLSTLPGITDLRPPMLEPELDLPLWSFLKDKAPDWLLPGVGKMPMHSVVALATNPPFVQALLLGANYQTTAEMRWRRHPLRAKASPLRKFWQRAGKEVDINPVKAWAAGEGFGGPSLTAPDADEKAVVVFRTPLFKRYPHTAVFMYPAAKTPLGDISWDARTLDPLDPNQCKHPIFTGTIGDDVVFFGFLLPASAFATYWVVLEEPPAGYRFYNDTPPGDPKDDNPPAVWPNRVAVADAATFAFDTFALPIRVMIGNLIKEAG